MSDQDPQPLELVNLRKEALITVMYCDIEGCPKTAKHDLAGLDLCEIHYLLATGENSIPVRELSRGEEEQETGKDRLPEVQG